ncbi:HAMP domain-containing sensor histidine kinase [Emticicia sp. CRIBPO]|uniref:sensor histidine kinase n=1 Tax=Emticicia sp. CRIBPO TaxID=2683258 RepID=UPI00286D86CB|nr:HAMP domain-containing sensor histidine kinase [Emticicia sp. CRIBPO]
MMNKNKVFFNIYEQLSINRIILIAVLMLFGAGVLYYFKQLGEALEEREEKYATLYAESIRFIIEEGINSTCDYTFVQEVLDANETVPTILVIAGQPSSHKNIPELDDSTRKWRSGEKEKFLYLTIAAMSEEHAPIQFGTGDQTGYVYYSNSIIVKQLRYFPYLLLGTFLIFGSLALIAYSSSRKAEQNRVWVGLAKETAHQLGTPISGLMAWVEVLRANPDFDQSVGDEMDKDIERLETITTRFSNIGSVPAMKDENLAELVEQTTGYLKRRISTKVNWEFVNNLNQPYYKKINRHLIEWVVENLCKNAVDAMAGKGNLKIEINPTSRGQITIDVSDTGKGISKMNQRKIFKAGFTTKNRGWGLGLTLAKRIIETYHDGQLFVKESTLGKGTKFRIII